MAIHVTEQLRTFLLSILLGLGAGVLYDLLRAVRLRRPRLPAPLVGHPAGWSGRRRSVFFPAFPAPAAGLGLLYGPVDGIVPISESTGTVLRRS